VLITTCRESQKRQIADALLKVEPAQKFIATDLVMPHNVRKEAGKCTDFNRIVGWNRQMVFAVNLGSKTDMASCLPRNLVTEHR
jgi:hypothetical protein